MIEQHPPSITEHTKSEFKDLWLCQKVIRDWVEHPEWESYEVLPVLYKALHLGERYSVGGPMTPTLAEVTRSTNSHAIGGSPENLFPPHQYAYLLTSKYTKALDEVLREKPKTIKKAIEDAAFSYYIFERIHPFPDGNGRIGRMIVKRVFKGADLKDPVFHDHRWFGSGRAEQIEAMEEVGNSNNLSHLEIYLAETLLDSYRPIGDFFKYRELSSIIKDKKRNIGSGNKQYLSDIWPEFNGVPVYGNGTQRY